MSSASHSTDCDSIIEVVHRCSGLKEVELHGSTFADFPWAPIFVHLFHTIERKLCQNVVDSSPNFKCDFVRDKSLRKMKKAGPRVRKIHFNHLTLSDDIEMRQVLKLCTEEVKLSIAHEQGDGDHVHAFFTYRKRKLSRIFGSGRRLLASSGTVESICSMTGNLLSIYLVMITFSLGTAEELSQITTVNPKLHSLIASDSRLDCGQESVTLPVRVKVIRSLRRHHDIRHVVLGCCNARLRNPSYLRYVPNAFLPAVSER